MRKIIAISLFALPGFTAVAQDADTAPKQKWFVPTLFHAQYAGNIGTFSAGAGYQLLRQKIQLSLFYGYVPRIESVKPIHTFALKAAFNIFSFNTAMVRHSFYLGGTFNVETGKNAYIRFPSSFPDNYYPYPNAFQATAFGGLRSRIPLKKCFVKSISPYIETGSYGAPLWYMVSQSAKPASVFSMALGLTFEI